MKRKMKNLYPKGWDARRVADVLDYYENRTEEAAAADIEEALAAQEEAIVIVPRKLVPAIRRLVARAG
jgi:hypothetical protein